MTSQALVPVFDGHNDVLLRLWRSGNSNAELEFLRGSDTGHLDLPRARAGGFAGGLFAVYIPSSADGIGSDGKPQAVPPSLEEARGAALELISLLIRLERAAKGQIRLCRTAQEIRSAMKEGALAAVFHIEGAEMIDLDLRMLDVLHQAGLRSLGPVWSRANAFGYGVPFRYPSSPDIGPGLTDHGRELIRACNRLRIMVDLSHLNEQGFWDVAGLSDAPLVASHSNAHGLTPHSRNLTDRQLDAIRESDGFVGVNFGTIFLRPDGRKDPETSLNEIVNHVDYLVERIGIDRVGFGSDFDGTTIPNEMRDVSGLPALVRALEIRGYDRAAVHKICYQNWISVLEKTWGC
ncbi:dipeptidase [Microvirga puerhi]|uniref:Dipeptidase n=1 Tax=Microvirga puerhi TaxID=2876078 RepID=A0ABS7VPD0_9HYPH|nr:dipeptidase [Microvirga puerhi]MBZ6076981.1 dipeptidase [Microvirga puerhi]